MLRVLKSGFYTTLQDTGRFGFRTYGVPVSGIMDSYSGQFANALLGNNEGDAVLEMTMLGGAFQFTTPSIIAISGAHMEAKLNDAAVKHNSAVPVNTGDILSFGRTTKGIRTYLAIKNGFKSQKVLGSRSQYKPITNSNVLSKNDTVAYDALEETFQSSNATVKFNDSIFTNETLEAYKGPEFDRLTDAQKHNLLHKTLNISKFNNRMAYQLKPLLTNHLEPILTAPVLPGTVQLTPQGRLIVLMRDCQTTGGYPRVLQLTEASIGALAQRSVGNNLKIRLKE